MAYPNNLDSFTDPQPTDRLNSPSHSGIEIAQNTALESIQSVVGIVSSTYGITYDVRSPNSNGGGHVQTANKGGTGQTVYTKGDLLVAQSSSVLTKVAIASVDGYALIIDSTQPTGVTWGVPNNAPTVRVYSPGGTGSGDSSLMGIWTKPSVLTFAVIEVLGAGGGGGGTTTAGVSAAGGGGGGYSKKFVPAASLPTAASVIVGRGGGGGVAAAGTGSVGGTTLFGSVFSATGGDGGTQTNGGNGGLGTGGDINVAGGPGVAGLNGGAGNSGVGGSNPLGGGGAPKANADGAVGRPYGGGGSGGSAISDGNDHPGGAGYDGIVIVYEY